MFSQACIILPMIGHIATRSLLILVMAVGTHPTGMPSCWDYYHPQLKLWEGHIFTDVCLSMGCLPSVGGMSALEGGRGLPLEGRGLPLDGGGLWRHILVRNHINTSLFYQVCKCMILSVLETSAPRQRSHDPLTSSIWAKTVSWGIIG